MKKVLIFYAFYGLTMTCFSQGVNHYYDIKSFISWYLSSIPFKQSNLFPESYLQNDKSIGFNRAKICWYSIDPLFLRNTSQTPDYIKNDITLRNNHFVREIYVNEVYPNYQNPNGIPSIKATLDISYYPTEKGEYNYDVDSTLFSNGIDSLGNLKSPELRWGGIMRKIEKNIFTQDSLNYLRFWLMDPFVYNTNSTGGNLYFNIGNISEDVLKDSKISFENGLPSLTDTINVITTAWGRISNLTPFFGPFTDINSQNIGFDGLNNTLEQSFFQNYLNLILNKFGQNSNVYLKSTVDPSSDDYSYYLGSYYDGVQASILERYKKYNNIDGNSSNMPDNEDINQNNILDTAENYYQYKIILKPESLIVGQNFITDKIIANPTNGDGTPVTWYKFLIPLSTNQREIIGNINTLDSSNFMRLFLNGFSDTTINLRFFELALVTNDLSMINEIPNNNELSIYPNPNKGELNIDNKNESINVIKIYDLIGRELLYSKQVQNMNNNKIDISFLNNGMYVIVIESIKNTYIKKLIIEK